MAGDIQTRKNHFPMSPRPAEAGNSRQRGPAIPAEAAGETILIDTATIYQNEASDCPRFGDYPVLTLS